MSGHRRSQGPQQHAVCTGAAAQLKCIGGLPAAMVESLLHSTCRSYETTTAFSHQCSPVLIALSLLSTIEKGLVFGMDSMSINKPSRDLRRPQHCRHACRTAHLSPAQL